MEDTKKVETLEAGITLAAAPTTTTTPTTAAAAPASCKTEPLPPPPPPLSSTSASANTPAYEIDASLPDEEQRFYAKAYPTVDVVKDRRVHCTVCKMHIGTAPTQESIIKMHPVLRVTHCTKCHDFYNSGEFSKGEDGSELYCRWCGQGGEVYCCSNCPFVFCKSCIVKNLSRGVVNDIEQNENWSCFNCSTKILWPLRAQHWALINFIDKQKRDIQAMSVPESEKKALMCKDSTACCRLGKAKLSNISDSMESLESATSRRSHGSTSSTKVKLIKQAPPSTPTTPTLAITAISLSSASPSPSPAAKRAKLSNDEVVCTPDLMSMLEPDCQLTVTQKTVRAVPMLAPPSQQQQQTPTQISASTPKVLTIQPPYASSNNSAGQTAKSLPHLSSAPPPLVLRNTSTQLRPIQSSSVVRRTVIGPRSFTPNNPVISPVYHTINGFRIDLNTAARQETFRLPNGKLIQVKRQRGPGGTTVITSPVTTPPSSAWSTHNHTQQQQQQQQHPQKQQHQTTVQLTSLGNVHAPSQPSQRQAHSYPLSTQRYPNNIPPANIHNSGSGNTTIQILNGATTATTNVTQNNSSQISAGAQQQRPGLVRHNFPDSPIGSARNQLQDQVFSAMEICQHLMGKLQTLTNSNAYKQARNYMDVKELYIHLSYLFTYGIGRYKSLQDKCLADMRQLGFDTDANSLENGQLAAGVDYVRYGQLDDIDLFDTGSNSFHNQVYEYRRSLRENLLDTDTFDGRSIEDMTTNETTDMQDIPFKQEEESLITPMEGMDNMDMNEREDNTENELLEAPEDTEVSRRRPRQRSGQPQGGRAAAVPQTVTPRHGTEESMRREEEIQKIDHKLTRLLEKYPAIWCTRHVHYGNFEVTRRYWKLIGSHFARSVDIKLRWKYIRKRFVRIEQRIRDGKRFSGFFDKATNFLANRNRDLQNWQPIDRGENESDDDFENIPEDETAEEDLEANSNANFNNDDNNDEGPAPEDDADYDEDADEVAQINNDHREVIEQRNVGRNRQQKSSGSSIEALEVPSMDVRIINFVKCNPILWHKAKSQNLDNESRCRTLWLHFWKSMPEVEIDEIIDRWKYLYDMYRTFRLQIIRDKRKSSHLETKYANYIARLRFLSDEFDIHNPLPTIDDYTEEVEQPTGEGASKLHEMPDDGEFVLALVTTMRQFRPLWDKNHMDYYDAQWRERLWSNVATKLQEFNRDLRAIKLRWQMAKFSYQLLLRDRKKAKGANVTLAKYYHQLPVAEMAYLDKTLKI